MGKNKLLLKYIVYMALGIAAICVGSFSIYSIINTDYRFSDKENIYESHETFGDVKTVLSYDKKYNKVNVNSKDDAKNLILEESKKQKNNNACNNSEIKSIESELETSYNILAVNLCELDKETANYLKDLVKYVFETYPSVSSYMTNLSLSNVSLEDEDYIVSFVPSFTFATANSKSTFPFVIKTQLLLNSKYYLDRDTLNHTVNGISDSGYFIKNATGYSLMAHEMGHYLSFVALAKKKKIADTMYVTYENFGDYYELLTEYESGDFSKKILEEAYYKYNGNANYKFENFLSNISSYAVIKDETGNIIYDEVIAESFHDVYVNKGNAHKESIAIINTLNKYL